MEMSDDALIRLENLRELGLGPSDLVKSVGSSYQYWRDLLNGNKSFGEKAARNIEEKLGMVRGALDIPGFSRGENALIEKKTATHPAQSATQMLATLEQITEALAGYLVQMDDDARDDAGDVLKKLAHKPENHARAAAMLTTAFHSGKRKVA